MYTVGYDSALKHVSFSQVFGFMQNSVKSVFTVLQHYDRNFESTVNYNSVIPNDSFITLFGD